MAQRKRTAARQRPAIEVTGLRKTYPGEIEAVRGIDFEVAPGEVFGLVGPNGAGKSTTIGMLTTTIVPTGGRAIVAGFNVTSEPLQVRRMSSVVFQESVVDESLTGRRNLSIHARLWGVPARAEATRIDELTESLGLDDIVDRTMATYSGGQRRRLEIARALVSRPAVLFLDEPTVGLDPRIRAELADVISQLKDGTGMTILLTTHYLEEAERLCDRVGIMHSGLMVAVDTPDALLAGLGAEVMEVRVDGDPSAAVAALRSRGIAGDDAYVVGRTVTVPLHKRRTARTLEIVHELGLRAAAISTRRPTLDDVYLRLTGDRFEEAV